MKTMKFTDISDRVDRILVRDNQLIVTGIPHEDDEEHNCDHMGCSSLECVLYRATIRV